VKRLIVNADDLGADEARNAGIFEAIREGSVTSVSILANGPALEDALQEVRPLKEKKISWGIHLNLSEGTPLIAGLRRLTGKDGFFLGKAPAHELLSRRGDPELEKEVTQEMKAQIQALRNAGIRISHLDGHQHIHVFPAVVRAAVRLARQHRISWMRVPEEPEPTPAGGTVAGPLLRESRNFSGLAKAARAQLEGTGIRTTDHFRGLYLKGRLSLPSLIETLEDLPEGFTEMMVHPGRIPETPLSAPFSGFSTLDRAKELEALLDKDFRKALTLNRIELIPFPEN
jgi:predicted glycoside hydrolase/deacetylase ChbG (UPF0249 family)